MPNLPFNLADVSAPSDSAPGLHVVHAVLSLDPGGLERVVLDLARQSCRCGQRVSIVCLERRGTLALEAEALGTAVFCADKPPGLHLQLILRLTRLLRDLRPDVVHTHQIGALFYAGPAARRAGAPLIVHTEHGKNYAGRRRTRWLGRIAARQARRFFCVSQDIAAEVRTWNIVPPAKIACVPNGIDIERFRRSQEADFVRGELGIPLGAPVVGALGRLSEIKRYDLLIRSFAALRTRLSDAHLLLVGDGPSRNSLEALAAELLPPGCVHFAGYQATPQRYLQAMNAMALTSESEGMPLAVLEAWAADVPVAAWRVGGVPELIADGETGLLIDFGNLAGMTAAVRRLLTEEALARRVCRAAARLVSDQFSTARMASNYQRHYQELLPAGQHDGPRTESFRLRAEVH